MNLAQTRRDFGLWRALGGLLILLAGHATSAGANGTPITSPRRTPPSAVEMTIGLQRFTVTLDDTPAARAFAARLPDWVDMAELNGNEKHADLPQPLPASASRPGTIRRGDIMLYGPRTLVVFYQTFSSPYAYTRIGRVDNPTALAQALGSGRVRIRFSILAPP